MAVVRMAGGLVIPVMAAPGKLQATVVDTRLRATVAVDARHPAATDTRAVVDPPTVVVADLHTAADPPTVVVDRTAVAGVTNDIPGASSK